MASLNQQTASETTSTGEKYVFIWISSEEELPCGGQMEQGFSEWIASIELKVGDHLAVRQVLADTHTYKLVSVVAVDHGRQRRIVIDRTYGDYGRSFYRTGKNCLHPVAQVRLVQPNDAVIEAAAARTEFVPSSGHWFRL